METLEMVDVEVDVIHNKDQGVVDTVVTRITMVIVMTQTFAIKTPIKIQLPMQRVISQQVIVLGKKF